MAMQLRLAQRREEALQVGLEAAGREREAAAERATAAECRCGELEGGCSYRCTIAHMHKLPTYLLPHEAWAHTLWRHLRHLSCAACTVLESGFPTLFVCTRRCLGFGAPACRRVGGLCT